MGFPLKSKPLRKRKLIISINLIPPNWKKERERERKKPRKV